MKSKIIVSAIVLSLSVSFFGLPNLGFAENSVSADLEVKSVGVLPTSPFYFIKEAGRAIQTFFTFNAEKKAELKAKIAEDKLIEAKIISEKEPENKGALEKALQNYQEQKDELKTRLQKLTETSKNPNISSLIQKIDEKIATHTELFNRLIIKIGGESNFSIKNWNEYFFKGFVFKYPSDWNIRAEDVTWPPGNPFPEEDVSIRIFPGTNLSTIQDSILIGKFGLPGGGYTETCPKTKVSDNFKCDDLKGIAVTTWSNNKEILDVFYKVVSSILPQSSKIKIISPVAGDKWKIGETHAIKISQNNPYLAHCSLASQLIDEDNNVVGYITPISEGKDFINWNTKTVWDFYCGTSNKEISIKSGKYKIKMLLTDTEKAGSPSFEMESDYFEIISSGQDSSSIRVISPNGGEKLKIGEKYEIKWNSPSNLSNFPIYISLKENNPVATHWFPIDSFFKYSFSLAKNTGSYYWKIPEKVMRPEGEILYLDRNTYLLRVEAVNLGLGQQQAIYDESDASFTIVTQ